MDDALRKSHSKFAKLQGPSFGATTPPLDQQIETLWRLYRSVSANWKKLRENSMHKSIATAAATALLTLSPSVSAQIAPRDVIGSILGTLFGSRTGATTSLDAQWASGQTPLNNQQYQFESRVDAEVRSGSLSQITASRLKSDYSALVQMESRYAADGRFSAQERADLTSRYTALTQVFADRGYSDGTITADVAAGRAEFNSRVDAAITARRITRTQGSRLKLDYTTVLQLETDYMRDGALTAAERDDLDARLDALDARLDGNASVSVTPQTRLDAIARALPTSGLTRVVQNQILVELGDLTRLANVYTRVSVTAEEQAYLDRRLADLELRARLRR